MRRGSLESIGIGVCIFALSWNLLNRTIAKASSAGPREKQFTPQEPGLDGLDHRLLPLDALGELTRTKQIGEGIRTCLHTFEFGTHVLQEFHRQIHSVLQAPSCSIQQDRVVIRGICKLRSRRDGN